MTKQQTSNETVLSRREAAAYLKVCLSTLYKLSIPKVKICRRTFYRPSDIERWIAHHVVKPEDEK
jgi:predicted DNA-binding transcriptional regulator AlpA